MYCRRGNERACSHPVLLQEHEPRAARDPGVQELQLPLRRGPVGEKLPMRFRRALAWRLLRLGLPAAAAASVCNSDEEIDELRKTPRAGINDREPLLEGLTQWRYDCW